MPSDEDMIELIAKSAGSPKEVAIQVLQANELRHRIRKVDREISELEVRHKAEVKSLAATRKAIVDQCKHLHSIYHPDPSGNNDSWDECVVCGREV